MSFTLRPILTAIFLVWCGGMLATIPAAAQFSRFATIGTGESGERFGELLHLADLNGNDHKDFIIGAPGAEFESLSGAGKIFVLENPVGGDSLVTNDSVILTGDREGVQLGAMFAVGDFNDSGDYDIAVSLPGYTEDNQGNVAVFFGPFESGDPVTAGEADVWIEGKVQADNFGGRLAVLPHQEGPDGLLIAASETADPESLSGNVYLFEQLSDQDHWHAEEAKVRFRNDQGNFFFGNDLDGGEDFTGNGYADVLISAHRADLNGSDSGAIYLFEGPFDEDEYEPADALTIIKGPSEDTLWGARIITQGDITGNELTDFAVSSLYDRNGRVAFFEGRKQWPEEIIVESEEHLDDGVAYHRIFASSGHNRDTGFDFDFTGDYNLDGKFNPLIGAPATNSKAGAASMYRWSGSAKRNFRPNISEESNFGTQVANLGNITEPGSEFGADDLAVSAPGASHSIGGQGRQSGVIYIHEGELFPPEVNLSYSPGRRLFPGDEVELQMSFESGSRPVETERLVIQKFDPHELIARDTIVFDAEEGRVLTESFTYDEDVRINFRYEAVDEIGMLVRESVNIHFTEKPDPFDLTGHKPDEELISISGDPLQEVRYEFTASGHASRDVSYRFAYSHMENGFEQGDYEIISSIELPDTSVTYRQINDYMRMYFQSGEEVPVYWNVYATNNIHHRWAENGPFEHRMILEGLDPYIELKTGNKDLIIEGRSEDTFKFEWQSENSDYFLQYYFRLLLEDDPDQYVREYPTGDNALETHYELSYGELREILEQYDLLESAKQDTIDLYYTVRTRINEDDNRSHFPDPEVQRIGVHYKELVDVSSGSDEIERIPEDFAVKPNYPNPFNDQTMIRFRIPEPTRVSIEIYDVLGQEVYSWDSGGELQPGEYEHAVRAADWSTGTYVYRVRTNSDVRSRTMMLLR